MDAEIGVRNLADPFRYNALPEIVKALGLMEGRLAEGAEDFEDLPEYEKLAMLSRAQAELNYAVHWSFLQAKVIMTDSLTASMKWNQYDDEFRLKNGYRLPADPYWLAPPQGSVIPLWHRGGAPNYQPKPMICKHVQDPIKAWNREKQHWPPNLTPLLFETVTTDAISVPLLVAPIAPVLKHAQSETPSSVACETARAKTMEHISCLPQSANRSIAIYFCSAGTIAEKLAAKLHKWTRNLIRFLPEISLVPHIRPLNNMKAFDLTPDKILLLVVSSTGEGEIPPNGMHALADICGRSSLEKPSTPMRGFDFAIFGNGDSRYSNTFNGAAVKFNDALRKCGGNPLAGGLYKGDVAIETIPLRALKNWFTKLEPTFAGVIGPLVQRPFPVVFKNYERSYPVIVNVAPVDDAVQQHDDHQQQLLSTLKDATLAKARPEVRGDVPRSRLLSLDVCNVPFEEMSCIQVLPLNARAKVTRALLALDVEASATMDIDVNGGSPTYTRFLSEFVDLELPFLHLEWFESINIPVHDRFTKDTISKMSMLEILERLCKYMLPSPDLRRSICLDMPLLRTRTYSIASSNQYLKRLKKTPAPAAPTRRLEIMAKVIPSGRFSDTYLTDSRTPSPLKYRIVDSVCGPLLRKNHLSSFIIVATGAGFGPVRCLLQWRIATVIAAGRTLPPLRRGISLFLGLKESDLELTLDVLNEAMALDLLDVLRIVVSNSEKRRVYDDIPQYAQLVRRKLLEQRGLAFVCTGKLAAEGTKGAMLAVLRGSVKELLKERYVEEVF